MTISSSLNAGVAGLAANASRLATISDNIANSATFGYKRAVADFHSMVIESGTGTYSAGGVRVTTQRLIDERGPLVSTSNPTDLAVRGRGLLPVTSGTSIGVDNGEFPLMLASTGSFRPDSEGYLTSPSGLVLMGWPAGTDGSVPTYPRDTVGALEPIRINTNQFSGNATTEMRLAVNLPATETEDGAIGESQSLSVEYFDNLGKSESLSIEFVPSVPAPGDPSTNEWTMILTDSASGGAVIGEYTMVFDDNRTTGGRLLSMADVSGGPYNPATGAIEVNVAGGPVTINIGTLGDPGGLTQLSDSFAPVSISKNGSPVGNMTSVEVDPNGFVHAYFDNGISRTIYQVPLVDVPNPNGLMTQDHQSYIVTPDSGPFFLWDAGDGPTGDVVSFAREESATDVAGELTQLIQTQRAYSSNAKVIQTVDEMLQETTNIKR
ncbi:MAG: flagellar hook protein FlgE [Paracoccaceae bacterium]|jgi:flagellar hook protein FlgE